MIYIKKKQKGYVALISVLIVGALTLVVSIGVSMRSISGSQITVAHQQSSVAYVLATACADGALVSLQSDLGYVGNEDIIIGGETCHIYPIEGSGNENRVVKTDASVGGFIKRVRVDILRISPTIQISSWENPVEL